jgi:hypothetical protein
MRKQPQARKFSRGAALFAATGLLVAGATPALAADTAAPSPLGPNQFFIGQVNGQTDLGRIAVDCDGPSDPVRTGHPAPGQTVAVLPAIRPIGVTEVIVPPITGPGFTGSVVKAIGATVSGIGVPVPAVLTEYETTAEIPTSILVPCEGTGRVVFAPSPTTPTSRPATVRVTFFTKS